MARIDLSDAEWRLSHHFYRTSPVACRVPMIGECSTDFVRSADRFALA